MARDRWVPIAFVTRPHGLRGEIRVRPFNPSTEVLVPQKELLLRLTGGAERAGAIEWVRGGGVEAIVKFQGIDDREQATGLRGALVLVDRRDLPEPEEGEFYLVDAIGARVRTASTPVGRVASVATYPAVDVLIVEQEGEAEAGRLLEIPITDAFVEYVDLAQGEIVLVDGALEQLV